MKIDIVGGSVSGLSAATSLKQHDKDITVVVHEKYKNIGYNPDGRRCGEAYRLEPQWNKWQPMKGSVFNEIKKTELIIDDKKYITLEKPGTYMILNRQEFIYQLAKKAQELGVDIKTNDKIKSVDDLDGDYIIDASGCPSLIKRELGLNKGLVGVTYQQTLQDSNYFNSDIVKIVFTELFGFYWIFPRNPEKNEINLGIGILDNVSYNLKEMLENFKKIQNVEGKINYTTGGLVPLGLQNPLKKRNILFIGDAGVGTFPLNGEGIYRALISGEIAGECIAFGYPEKYPILIKRKFIKWDISGKMYLQINHILKRIGPKAVFAFLNNSIIYTTAVSSLKKFT